VSNVYILGREYSMYSFRRKKKNLQTDVYDINFVLQKRMGWLKLAETVSLR